MASGRIGSASGLNVFIDWSSTETSITANLYLYNQYRINTSVNKTWSITINGNTTSGTVYLGEKAAGTTTHIGSHTVSGLAANTSYGISGVLNINLTSYNGSAVPSLSASGSGTTEAYKYTTVYNSLRGRTSSSISINWSTTDARDYTQYSLNGGGWTDAGDTVASDNKSGYYTISGLAANTSYTVKTRCRRADSGLWSEATTTVSTSTYAKTTPTISLSNKTSSSITVTSGCNVSVSSTQYRIKTSSGSYGSYQTSGTFSGLSANTSYTIEVKKVGSDSGEAGTATVTVTTYAKTTPTISLSSKSVNSITVTSGCNVTVSSTQYRIKTSSGSYGSYQTGTTFSNLSPNTAYVVEVKKVGTDSGESGTATLSVTTYNIATMSAANNFNLGDSHTITYSNPMGSSVGALDACISFTGDLDDIGYRAVSKTGTSYTFSFTDAELDKLYKKYGTGNTISAISFLRTTHNNKTYHNTKNITITLTGNQKTGHTNVSNAYRRGKYWTNVNGTWRRAVIWNNVNGTWKRGI